MSRYSRSFGEKSASPAIQRDVPGYSRYREKTGPVDKPLRAAASTCQLCDGLGQYDGAHGPVDCDLCEGSGVLGADAQEDVVMFRSRNRS